jgi:hypothetical protein
MVDGARWVEAHEHKLVLVAAGLGPVHLLDRHLPGPSGLGISAAASCGVLSLQESYIIAAPRTCFPEGMSECLAKFTLTEFFKTICFDDVAVQTSP